MNGVELSGTGRTCMDTGWDQMMLQSRLSTTMCALAVGNLLPTQNGQCVHVPLNLCLGLTRDLLLRSS